ncbi:ninein isoform X2 [Pelobates cultripes]|uniref:Ninein-like protein n=1 Tax=Pelobates cultripes TaxID=61616 RepID=A0AAD1RGC1_PELCU|nr:ninein isoform X2 [Pelobates cultripes]
MDQEEENKYVSQLQDVFNSCDTTGTGYLDKEELTDLCRKLHLDAQLPLLLQTLLGNDTFARVNFDEFKEGFVAVLSSTIDISISEDESSYLEPVIPDEVKPKFVKGTKRYGRRTQPEFEAAENEANKYMQEQHNVKCKRKGQIRRSSSLESVESLKSDEEAESAKEPHNENFEGQGQLRVWESEFFASPGRNASLYCDMTEHQVRAIWEELGVGCNGYLNLQELATVCQNIGLKDFSKEKIEDLFKKLDRDGDGKVSFVEFQLGLFNYAPLPFSSTPLQQRRPWAFCQSAEDSSRKTATSSLLSSCGAIHLFTSIDDGTGFGNPEQIMIIWEEEGIEDSKDLLMSLDFNLEERINLLDLTTALDNELIAAKNRFHLAALASYKHELHYQHGQVNQVTKERDKFKQDLEKAEKRNLQLADEVDDHNSTMEQLNESKIKELEQEYRQRLAFIRTELEREKDQFLQNTNQHRTKMESDLASFQVEEAFLRDKLNLSIKENSRLQKEMVEIVGKLSESEKLVEKLQNTVDRILKEKGVTDPLHSEIFVQEEHFAEIIKQYEAQCRELRDQNDELQIQLETLRSQLSESKYSRLLARMKDNKLLHLKAKEKLHLSNGVPGKKGLSTRLRRSSSAAGADVTVQSENLPMNMETELTKHQIKEQQQEIQDLKIQLETKVIYYEREVELMKSNFEKERRETEQSFKIEISELEEQKADLEGLNTKYQEVIDGLKEQLNKSAHIQDIEKKFEKERIEMEQYYATEISTLSKKLTGEKEQLEEEIKRFHQQELQTMRMELSRLSEDNSELKNKLERLQQDVGDLEELNKMTRLHLEDAERENSKLQSDLKEMDIQNKKYLNEMSQLNSHLNGTVSEILAKQESIQQLTSRLQEVTQQREEADATIKQLQETLRALEKEKLQQLLEWENARQRLEQDLLMSKVENEKYQDELSQMNSQSLQLNGTVSDLSTHNMAKQETIQQLTSKLQEVTQQRKEAEAAIKQLQETLSSLEKEKLQQLSVWQHERQRLEQELLMYKEKNDKYQDELSRLNSHLNGTVSDLSAQIMAKQETIQQLTSRLQKVTQQREEADAAIKQLQETLSALEKEKLQQLSVWKNQRQRLEQDLLMSKEKNDKYQDDLSRLNSHSLQLNCTVSDLSAQIMAKQETIQQLTSRLPEVAQQKEESDSAVKRLQETLCALEKERLQQLSAWQNDRQRIEQELRISKEKVLALEALEVDVSILIKEKQDLLEQCQRVTTQVKETADKVIQMDKIESDLKQAQQECQTLRTVQNQLREQLDESQDQLMEANLKLTLAQSQHMREVQQLKEQVSSAAPMDQLSHLQDRLLQEQQKVQQMQEKLRFHAEQANRQLAMQQEAHEKLLRKMEDRMESVEMNLKNVRLMLQDKVSQLKEQLERNSKSDLLLKDLYVENAHLMKALQVTEERQKSAEKKNYVLEEKIFALNKVIKKIAPASLAV